VKWYAFLVVLEIGVLTLQAMMYYRNGFGNFAIDFFGDYLLQTFFAFVFVDVHWPQLPAGRDPRVKERLVDDGGFPAAEEKAEDLVDLAV
jgi:hypothetical protein